MNWEPEQGDFSIHRGDWESICQVFSWQGCDILQHSQHNQEFGQGVELLSILPWCEEEDTDIAVVLYWEANDGCNKCI